MLHCLPCRYLCYFTMFPWVAAPPVNLTTPCSCYNCVPTHSTPPALASPLGLSSIYPVTFCLPTHTYASGVHSCPLACSCPSYHPMGLPSFACLCASSPHTTFAFRHWLPYHPLLLGPHLCLHALPRFLCPLCPLLSPDRRPHPCSCVLLSSLCPAAIYTLLPAFFTLADVAILVA